MIYNFHHLLPYKLHAVCVCVSCIVCFFLPGRPATAGITVLELVTTWVVVVRVWVAMASVVVGNVGGDGPSESTW